MEAFHTFRVREKYKKIILEDFELFTLALSALEWRKHNGEIKLITDYDGAKLLSECGLTEAWDKIEIILDDIKELNINENVFWAGAKLFALSRQTAPCVMIDLDFILWKTIDFDWYDKSLAVIHKEDIKEPVYPSKSFFKFKEGWRLPYGLDWSARRCNAALVYFGSDSFISKYTAFALEFMQMADTGDDCLSYMVFAEQRWMAMCAEKFDVPIHELSSLEGLFDGKQKYFTHVWGYKQRLRDNPQEADEFCRKCGGRLKHDFPEFAARIKKYAWAAKYM